MKKSIPAALVCAAALLIPSTAYACPTDCSASGGGDNTTQLDVKDHASTQVDTEAAQKEVDRARSFMDASADLSQSERDCFLGKVLEGSYYDKDSRSVRTDTSARVSENVESSQHSSESYAAQLARWLYEHEDTWQDIAQDYQLGDVLSFSKKGQFATNQSSAEFFASIEVVAVYVGDGRVIYCAKDGSSTQVKEESVTVLEAELNVTVSLVSRPCDLGDSSAAPSAAPSESAADQSCQRTCQSESSNQPESSTSSSESTNASNETSQDSSQSSSVSTSSESTESSSTSSESTNVSNESSSSSSDVSSTSSESTNTTSESASSTESSNQSESSTSSTSSDSATSSEPSSTSSDNSSSQSSTESSDDSSSSVAAPEQSSSTTAPSSSSSSSSSTKSSSARPSSLPRTGAGAVLPIAGIAVIAAAASGSILARRRNRV
ncbi:hypothetical protein [Propionibacterium australiense]|uniref:Lipoprotein-like n=1 Tax=Propionibacterium australiense TaxID=119981 RepID=A0A383SAU8_9ACTN|nr:hypothetical protein [Propionibacterium australiense]SYZ34489.1 Lipoprotein-like [Propionibacterium australiense]VEH88987.1 Uncharacterised protein [Propionibacterium australiense]